MRLAGIVLYNPNLERLSQNIVACATQVNEIICIDNGSRNIAEVEELISRLQELKSPQAAPFIKIIKNDENLGIAKALNQILYYG